MRPALPSKPTRPAYSPPSKPLFLVLLLPPEKATQPPQEIPASVLDLRRRRHRLLERSHLERALDDAGHRLARHRGRDVGEVGLHRVVPRRAGDHDRELDAPGGRAQQLELLLRVDDLVARRFRERQHGVRVEAPRERVAALAGDAVVARHEAPVAERDLPAADLEPRLDALEGRVLRTEELRARLDEAPELSPR